MRYCRKRGRMLKIDSRVVCGCPRGVKQSQSQVKNTVLDNKNLQNNNNNISFGNEFVGHFFKHLVLHFGLNREARNSSRQVYQMLRNSQVVVPSRNTNVFRRAYVPSLNYSQPRFNNMNNRFNH